jgi:hypothetical protein
MGIEELLRARPEALVCQEGHEHAKVPVWARSSSRRLQQEQPADPSTARTYDVRGRGENWRPYPTAFAFDQGHVPPCKVCLPALAANWRELMDRWQRQRP